jgi:hypothetical protein
MFMLDNLLAMARGKCVGARVNYTVTILIIYAEGCWNSVSWKYKHIERHYH